MKLMPSALRKGLIEAFDANDLIASPIFVAVITNQLLAEAKLAVHIHIAKQMEKPAFLIISDDAKIPDGYLNGLNISFIVTVYPGEEKEAFLKLDKSLDKYIKEHLEEFKRYVDLTDDPVMGVINDGFENTLKFLNGGSIKF